MTSSNLVEHVRRWGRSRGEFELLLRKVERKPWTFRPLMPPAAAPTCPLVAEFDLMAPAGGLRRPVDELGLHTAERRQTHT